MLGEFRLTGWNYFWISLSNIGINDWANANENTNFGPVVNNLGVKPLKKAVKPSFFKVFLMIVSPLSGLSKFLFWILVLMTSNGAETIKDAEAPTMDETKF